MNISRININYKVNIPRRQGEKINLTNHNFFEILVSPPPDWKELLHCCLTDSAPVEVCEELM